MFAANGSNEVLQTLLLAYAGPGRTVVTFEPTYQLHGHIARITGATVVEGGATTTSRSTRTRRPPSSRDAQPAVTFLCSPNNPTGLVESPAVLDAVLDAGARARRGRRGVRPVLALVGARPGRATTGRSSSCARSPRRGAWRRPGSATSSGPSWLVAQLEKVVLPYHLDAAKQVAGRVALRFVDDMDAACAAIVEERGRVIARRWPSSTSTCSRRGANFVLFRTRRHDAGAVWQRLVDHGVLIRDCSSAGRVSTVACASRSGSPPRTTASSRPAGTLAIGPSR